MLISAGVPRENAATCPTGTRSRPNPDGSMGVQSPDGSLVLMAWRYVPARSGPTYAFPNVFHTNTNLPARCVPTSIWVDLDASYPDFTSTIQERNEVNNKRIVNISGFPYRRTWVWQKPVMVPR